MMSREIPVSESDRVAVELAVRALDARHGASIVCHGEFSRDGEHWTAAPDLTLRATAPGMHHLAAPASGGLLRFVLELEGPDAARAAIELRVELDPR